MTIKELYEMIKRENLPDDTEIDFECSVDEFTVLDCACDMICTNVKRKYIDDKIITEKPRLCFDLRNKMYNPDEEYGLNNG